MEILETHFHIRLFEHNEAWSAKAKLYRVYDHAKEPEVDMFVSELNSALKAQLDFDFSKYWSHWKKEDSHFHASVLDSSKNTWIMRD